jgi:predicted RNA-binding Zn ribbon-like protein
MVTIIFYQSLLLFMITSPEPLFIADHLALDFLNTTFGTTNRVELINNDLQVYQWMSKAGVSVENMAQPLSEARGELLRDALELRAIANDLIIATKNRNQIDPSRLNTFLICGSSYYQIEHNEKQRWILKTHRRLFSAKESLTPIAEAIADLIVNADFSLVRQCESPECILWFYDKTKSHQRRWCDMAICGNRTKAAAFRARKKVRATSNS